MTKDVVQFSEQECLIIAFMADGYTNGQISQQLSCSEPAVEKSLQHMMQKLRLAHLYQLISWAYLEGVLR
ncbi:helix-turn-helix domain-containing protein [Pontibacter rugosus]|uniref:Helix-turn-helix domain-containing protein n=1 Tax=Pontibacter rugosus TaxID=1745966 RepID=A0ABW3SM76_9BACT